MANLQYIGARYVPKFYLNPDYPAPDQRNNEWKSGVDYEALTIVTYNNDSYTSKKPVPAEIGNPADNVDYWSCTTKYTAALQALQTIVGNHETEINDLIAYTTGLKVFVTPEMFGAVGDGDTDDSDAFISMFNFATNNNIGMVICGKNAKYKITSTLTLPADVEINFNDCIFIVNGLNSLFETTSIVKYTDHVSTITAGTVDIPVNNASTLKVGDLVLIKGDNLINGDRDSYVSGITSVITKISGNTITIANAAIYDIENPTINIYDKRTLILRNLGGIEGTLNYAFTLYYLQNVSIDHFNIDDCKITTLIGFSGCYNAFVTNSNIKCHNDSDTLCYPVFFAGTTNGNVIGCYIESTWHCVSTGGATPTLYTHIDKCVLIGSGTALAFGEHGNAFYSKISDSDLTGAVIGNFATIDNCDIKASTGISGTPCWLELIGNDIIDIDFYIKNIRFHKITNLTSWGIVIGFAPTSSITSSHIRTIYIDGITDGAFFKRVVNAAVDIENLYCNHAKNTIVAGVGGWNYKLTNATIENSQLVTLDLEHIIKNDGTLTVKNCIIDTLTNINLPNYAKINRLEHVIIKSDTIQVKVGCGVQAKNIFIDVVLETNDFGSGIMYANGALDYLIDCDIPYMNYGSGDKLLGIYNTRLSNTFVNSFLNGASGSYFAKKLSIDASNNITASDL